MAQVVDGRYTTRMDEPFAVFIIGIWLPLYKDHAAIDRRVIRSRSTEVLHNAPTIQLDWEIMLMVQIVPGSRETPRLQMSPGQSCTRLSQDHGSEIRARRRDGAQH
jgi:hypothetical protein